MNPALHPVPSRSRAGTRTLYVQPRAATARRPGGPSCCHHRSAVRGGSTTTAEARDLDLRGSSAVARSHPNRGTLPAQRSALSVASHAGVPIRRLRRDVSCSDTATTGRRKLQRRILVPGSPGTEPPSRSRAGRLSPFRSELTERARPSRSLAAYIRFAKSRAHLCIYALRLVSS